MLHIGDRIGIKARQGIGTVVTMTTNHFSVEFTNGIEPESLYRFGYSELGIGGVDAAWLYDCPHPDTSVQPQSYRDAAIERLAYNGGAMEYCLFAAWQSLSNALDSANANGNLRLKLIVGSVIESIEKCADQLKPKGMADGTVKTPYLTAQIHANRK